jgi:hypothetical protein
MKSITTLMLAVGVVLPMQIQAATTFVEGSRDSVTLHPSCRTENTGLTALGVVLPNGPEIKVTVSKPGEEKTTSIMSLPYPDALISTNRKGEVFDANPVMGAAPSLNNAAIFGAGVIKATVAAYGSRKTTEDTKMVFWKLKEVNSYDVESNTLTTLPYMPAGDFITVELGVVLPKFTPSSCLKTLRSRGAQIARCDQIDPDTKTILAKNEPDIRKKRMRLTIERDLMKNPLPEHCGEGLDVTVEPTDAEVDALKAKMEAMTP